MGDTPDLSNMSPEEMMRWLESLAAKQGASADQFVTAADMDVPDIDPETADMTHVGPGYVPSETFSFSSQEQPTQAPSHRPAEAVASSSIPASVPAMPQSSANIADDMSKLAESDPMAFLNALAARQGANPNEIVGGGMDVPTVDPNSVVIDEPGYVPSEKLTFGRSQEPATPSQPPVTEAPTFAPAPQSSANIADDMSKLAESDPMAFLNALAARQGANPNEIVGGGMDVPTVDPNSVVIDEPGYVPSEKLTFGRTQQPETPPPPPVSLPEPEPIDFVADFAAEFATEIESDFMFADSLEEADLNFSFADSELAAEPDPMGWLQSLTGDQQSSDLFEFESSNLQELDPAQTDFFIDAQDTRAVEAIIDAGGPPAGMFDLDIDLDQDSDSLAWLADLAGGQGDDVSDFLSDLTDEAVSELPGFELDFDSVEESLPFEEVGGLDELEIDSVIANASDEEIAQMQRDGTITPEQELQWLTLKANRMNEILQGDETFDYTDEKDALPAELPSWVRAQMPSSLDDLPDTFDAAPTFIEDITLPPEPEDLPVWLSMDVADALPSELELPSELSLEDTLPQEPITQRAEPSSPVLTDQMVQAYDPKSDPWAAAFDPEGNLDDPNWYEAAVAKVEAEMMQEGFQEMPEFAGDSTDEGGIDWMNEVIEAPVDEGLPSWLSASVEGDATISDWLRGIQTGGVDDDAPAWTQEPVEADDEAIDLSWLGTEIEEPAATVEDTPAVPTPVAVMPPTGVHRAATQAQEPVSTELPQGIDGALPTWYLNATGQKAAPVPSQPQPVQPQRQPEPVRQPEPPRSQPQPSRVQPPTVATPAPAPVPAPALQALYDRVTNNPEDHDSRLNLARGLQGNNNVNESLNQYETLVNQFAMLDVVVEDLQGVVSRVPNHPKARRLLGDGYMRQGRLQEALDTYRGALSNI